MSQHNNQPETPQLYLIAPAGAQAAALGPLLTEALDRVPVACLRLQGAGDEVTLGNLADLAREICHARDIPVVMEDHVELVRRHGLDGVHLTDNRQNIRSLRKLLGPDAIIGAFCGASRHDGMTAGEAGADYISFGPVGETSLGAGPRAEEDLFAWWSEMIEIPVVAEGALDADLITRLLPITDFIALGPEIWGKTDPAAELARLWS